MKKIDGNICAPKGFSAAGIYCGIRKNPNKKDLALIFCDKECSAAAVYTQNKVFGAPIVVTRKHLADGHARAVICNSGNANTCNTDGVEKADMMGRFVADTCGVDEDDVIVASTGVIGQTLDVTPISAAMGKLKESLSDSDGTAAAEAIMTTDKKVKALSYEFEVGGKACRIGAISKGSGMIHPNMATMLCFITTDAAIAPPILQKALNAVVADTFNMISVDGDTSTNDMVTILASGLAGNEEITECGAEYDEFGAALLGLCTEMAKLMASDGEGADKLLECRVTGAESIEDAKLVARAVISSSLFKAAMFGADANWGRVLCAAGYSGAAFDPAKVEVAFSSKAGSVTVCKKGGGCGFSEELAKKVLSESEVTTNIDLGGGDGEAAAWGCDLTYDYVKINGDYRS